MLNHYVEYMLKLAGMGADSHSVQRIRERIPTLADPDAAHARVHEYATENVTRDGTHAIPLQSQHGTSLGTAIAERKGDTTYVKTVLSPNMRYRVPMGNRVQPLLLDTARNRTLVRSKVRGG